MTENDLQERIVLLESRVADIELQLVDLDTQLNAAEQALKATYLSQKNKQKIDHIDNRLEFLTLGFHALVRSVHAVACVTTGALLFWFGSPMIHDELPSNDLIGSWLYGGGVGCIVYGLLVLTSNDRIVLEWLQKINPWSK